MDDSIQIGYLKWAVSQIQEGGGKLLTLPSDKDGQIVRRPSWIWRLHPLGGRDYRLSIRCRCPWHSMIFVGGSLYGWWNFFFFFLFIQGWREDVIFYSFWDIWGIEKGLSFFGRGFFETWNYSAWYFFFFFLFFSEDFIFICIALDILMKSDHRRIDIMFVSVWIFMSLIFFFFFHFFFFLLSFFIGLCDLLMLFIHGPCSIGYVKYVYSS